MLRFPTKNKRETQKQGYNENIGVVINEKFVHFFSYIICYQDKDKMSRNTMSGLKYSDRANLAGI